jgi:hypothetical protein
MFENAFNNTDRALRNCKVDDLAGHRLGEIIAFREGLHRVFFR